MRRSRGREGDRYGAFTSDPGVRAASVLRWRRGATVVVACLVGAVLSIDNTILSVALPTLSREVHASTSELQWIVDAYLFVFGGLLLTSGSLSDRYGRVALFRTGLVIF